MLPKAESAAEVSDFCTSLAKVEAEQGLEFYDVGAGLEGAVPKGWRSA